MEKRTVSSEEEENFREVERLFDLLREGAAQAALDEEAAMALALEAQRAVRAGDAET